MHANVKVKISHKQTQQAVMPATRPQWKLVCEELSKIKHEAGTRQK